MVKVVIGSGCLSGSTSCSCLYCSYFCCSSWWWAVALGGELALELATSGASERASER